MSSDEIESELERTPFVQFRLHLVSGKTIDITTARAGFMLFDDLMIFHTPKNPRHDAGYDVVSLRNIERLEQLEEPSENHER